MTAAAYRRAGTPLSVAAALRRLRPHVAVLSYSARVGFCVGFASLLPVLTDWSPAAAQLFQLPLFAPVFVAVALGPAHVGVVLDLGSAILTGWLVGACLTCAVVVAAHAAHGSKDSTTYVVLVVLCLLVLYPEHNPLAAKMAANCVIITVFTTTTTDLRSLALFPWHVVLSVVAGMVPCLLFNVFLPWPGARACLAADCLVRSISSSTSELALLLCRMLGDNSADRGTGRAAQARATALRASAAAAMAELQALVASCDWEAYVGMAPRAHFMHWLSHRIAFLREALLYVDGLHMTYTSLKVVEAQHARAVQRVRMQHRSAEVLRTASGRVGSIQLLSPGSMHGGDGQQQGELDRIDAQVGPHVAALGEELCTALAGHDDDASHHSLDAAWTTVFRELDAVRTDIYYSTVQPSFAEATLTSYGPPVEHYAYVMCLQQLVAAVQRAAAAAREAPPPGLHWTAREVASALWMWATIKARGGLLPFTRRPQAKRLLYAVKLVGAVVIAAWLGVLTSGNGTWAAITCQIVGARASVHVGGSFHTASARLSGTMIGSMFAYFCLVVLRPSAHGHPGTLMVLLGLWAALLAVPRTSPKHAYGALVASFVPYIVVLGSTRGSSKNGSTISSRELAYTRIEQNLLGILVWILVELLIWPQRASRLLPTILADTLRASSACMSAAWSPLVSGCRCAACAAEQSVTSVQARRAMVAGMARLEALSAEAGDEPAWLSTQSQRKLLALTQVMRTRLRRLQTVLELMHYATEELSPGGVPSPMHIHLAGPLQPVSRALQSTLSRLFERLAMDLETSRNHEDTIAAAAGVDTSLEWFEQTYVVQLIRLRDEHLQARTSAAGGDLKPPALEIIMAIDALLFFTRDVSATVDGITGAVREFLKDATADEGDPKRDAHDVEGLAGGVTADALFRDAAPEAGDPTRCQCGAPLPRPELPRSVK